jgi:hypothetical protein
VAVLHWVPVGQGALAHVRAFPVHGSVQVVPHQFAGHAVAGVQQVALSALEHCSPVAQFVAQSRVAPVQGSACEPQ